MIVILAIDIKDLLPFSRFTSVCSPFGGIDPLLMVFVAING